ncbi:MAG TPA: TetR/AcrR family transcriptional regulator [Amycolatopsis sp.]|uniref:TetR/AcrR family transcriptional regulator n=1 Tax=Amycolatopsis sp. TaxID=37632 RepID=UPI002B4A542D|nr:TetR/AcrR family transcriptional regulator [Amycolatopsis sp.]HKS43554.1 TetR/AcrR family transcriptional regulator [Amycolatopsis sp.]
MPRLTRAESQAHTRDRLIATATELFLRDGYSGTSLGKVAQAAGYSKGAVYSNFRSKDELCLAVLDRIRAERDATMAESLSTAEGPEDLLRAFSAWWERVTSDETWMMLEIEYLTHARRDPKLRHQMAVRNAEVRRSITQLLTSCLDRCGLGLPVPPEVVGIALYGMSIGLGLLRSVDGDLDLGALPAVLQTLVTAGGPDATPPPEDGPETPAP